MKRERRGREERACREENGETEQSEDRLMVLNRMGDELGGELWRG